jgi:hypothetical protein
MKKDTPKMLRDSKRPPMKKEAPLKMLRGSKRLLMKRGTPKNVKGLKKDLR